MSAAKLEQDVANALRTELLSPEAVEFVVFEVRRGAGVVVLTAADAQAALRRQLRPSSARVPPDR